MSKGKILAILLAILNIVSLCPPAAKAAGDNLLTNGDFEAGTTAWGNTTGTYAGISEETLYNNTGNKLKLSRTDTTNSNWIYQIIYPSKYTPGASYHAKAEIYGDLTESDGFALMVKYYKTGKPEYRSNSATRFKGNTNGRWNIVEFDFTVPDDCNESIRIWLRLFGAGTVYVDNVALYETAGPDPYALQNSHVFHYAGTETGTLSARLHDFYAADSTMGQAKVTFTISDGTTVLKTESKLFTNREAVFFYQAGSYLTQTRKSCTYSIRVHTIGGETLKERTGTLYLVPRPSRLTENGDYILHGKVFNPVIGYHIPVPTDDTPDEENGYKAAKEAGLNVVIVSMGNSRWGTEGSDTRARVENALAQLKKYDLYGIFVLYGSHSVSGGGTRLCTAAGCASELANTKAMAENLATEERVFGWAIMDEPFGAGVKDTREAELELAYKEIRARDTMHPIFICDYTDVYFSTDIKYCDVFAPDIYSGSQTRVQEAGENAIQVAKAQNKPVYIIVSVYTGDYVPTEQTVRHNIYQALFAGAKGIGYYSFDECGESGKELLWKTELFDGLMKIGTEIPVLFETMIGKSFIEEKTADYILRRYAGGVIAILPLCKTEITVPLEAGRGVIPISGAENRLDFQAGRFYAAIGSYTPMLFSYTEPLQLWRDGKPAEFLSSGSYTVTYAGCADLYAGVYCGKELCTFFSAKNTSVLVVTVPEGEYTLSAFAFLPGTLHPLTKKQGL